MSFQTNGLRNCHIILTVQQQRLIRGLTKHSLFGAKIGYLYFSDCIFLMTWSIKKKDL